MKARREKGLIIIGVIILVCIMLLFFSDLGFAPDSDAVIPAEEIFSNGKEQQGEALSDGFNYDISVADSLNKHEMEESEEGPMDELVFLLNNFAYERSANQLMMGVMAAILVIYLIVTGPVCYFYLKKIKKMEHMWLLIPAASLLFGFFVLFCSNDFIIQEPQMDVLAVITPEEPVVCYAASTSPAEKTYTLSFDETVKSIQTSMISHDFDLDEEKRTLSISTEEAFVRDYFQYETTMLGQSRIQWTERNSVSALTGTLSNYSGFDFSHIMICYENHFYIVNDLADGDSLEICDGEWQIDSIGMEGTLLEELKLCKGLNEDEEQIFNFAWYRHSNMEKDRMHIAAVTKDCKIGMIDTEIDLISYGLLFQ